MKLRCKLQTGKIFEMYKRNRQLLWMVKLRVIFYNKCAYFFKEDSYFNRKELLLWQYFTKDRYRNGKQVHEKMLHVMSH